jgi:hypothetical protein
MHKLRKIAVLLAVTAAMTGALTMAFRGAAEGSIALFGWAIGPSVALATLALVRARREGALRDWARPEWGDITRGVVGGAALFASAFAFVKVLIPVGSPREAWMARIYLQIGDPAMLRAHIGLVAVGVVIAAAAEEIVWRGLVQDIAGEVFGPRAAWIGSATLYALAHTGTAIVMRDGVAGYNPMLVFAALGAGLVWGAMRKTFDRLLPGIFAHALFDWAVVMMFRLWGPSI